MTEPQRLLEDATTPATLRALLAPVDDDGPSAAQLQALRSRIETRRRRTWTMAFATLTVAAAIVVAILLAREPSTPRIHDTPSVAPAGRADDAGARTTPPDAPLLNKPPQVATITIDVERVNTVVYVDSVRRGTGTTVLRGIVGDYVSVDCTYPGHAPGKLRLQYKAADQRLWCRPTPPPKPGLVWDIKRGWVRPEERDPL